ncbi:hypothetical protein PZE06_20545 [Robertmurraya sp. DFI.2.37]|nr:hypothetical protein [Robertmurraya sp. DFI.2.37]MDF1510527.1 hypothetical protein [Robertmurraya sp. DFI.2.37]
MEKVIKSFPKAQRKREVSIEILEKTIAFLEWLVKEENAHE